MQRFFVNGPHIKKTVPSPEKENEPKQISRRVLPRNSAAPHTESAPSLSLTRLSFYFTHLRAFSALFCSASSPLVFASRSYYSFTDIWPTFTLCLDEDGGGEGYGAASFVICIGLQNEQQQQQREKRKKFQIFLNEFNIHKV